ncbi:GAF domain-containing protein [Bombilactobacillus thymidiniphilus]|uniref:GAF domain-containing protein n=1 Tax=Bombilactobacillus thymidiniphilus TaxID=2923363 RepID=A0ABY4PCZ3_9LACO|nr:GAF domain-containing protein [Bombilactobacillus thymidiniphilus]UQS83567.1 GAF domain-containing protein [Bombilactobacillus thymidiniphilus]
MKKNDNYELLLQQAQSLFSGEYDLIANCSNLVALLFSGIEKVSYAGFYRYSQQELVLGPFQGPVACMHISLGTGVCGVAAQTQQTQIVPNVHEFAGHIACDAQTNSEIVLPIVFKEKLWGVLDLDSPELNNFDEIDARYLKKFLAITFH